MTILPPMAFVRSSLRAEPPAVQRSRPPAMPSAPPPFRRKRQKRPQLPIQPAAMRVHAAASYLDLNVETIHRLIREQHIETCKIGTSVVVLTRSLDALIEAGRRTPSRVPAQAQPQPEAALADEGGQA
jgi:hypothetical protein